MKIRNCEHCSEPFQAKKPHHKLCSDACRKAHATEQRRAWHRKHRPGMLAYWATYHRKHRVARNAANLARYYAAKREE